MLGNKRVIKISIPLVFICLLIASLQVWFSCSKKGTINPVAPALQVEIDTLCAYPNIITGGYSSEIYARVLDSKSGEPRKGVAVDFSTSYGLLTVEKDLTNEDGVATTTLRTPVDSTTNYIADISATVYSSVTKTVQVYIYRTGYRPPDRIVAVTEVDSVPADGGVSEAIVKATVLDENSNPIPGMAVTFSIDDPELTVIPQNGGITDSLGNARAKIPSPSTPRTVRVTVSVSSVEDYTDVTFLSPAYISTINLVANRRYITANGSDTTTITAQVYTNYGTIAPEGTRIRFTTSAGTLLPIEGYLDRNFINLSRKNRGTEEFGNYKVLLDGEVFAYTTNGEAKVRMVSSTDVDTALVVATADSATDSITVYFDPGEPYNINLIVEPSTIIANGRDTSRIDAVVTDEFGNRVGRNIPIDFTTDLGTISPATAMTNSNGVARARLRSGTTSGYASVTASWQTTVIANTNVFFASTVADDITLRISPQSIRADGLSQATVKAQVLDENSYPVSDGVPVVISTEQGILSLPDRSRHKVSELFSQITAFTDSGWVEVVLTSSTEAGTTNVIARADTSGVTVAADTSWAAFVPGPVISIEVEPDTSAIFANGADTTWITATLYDEFGNHLLAGTSVEFSTSDGTINPAVLTTNSSGQVRTILTSSRDVTRAVITAQSGEIIGETYVDFVATIPAEIVLTAERLRLPADGVSTDTITARVYDSEHYPVSNGTGITFTADRGFLSEIDRRRGRELGRFSFISSHLVSSVRDFTHDGIIKVLYTSPTTAGDATIIATTDTSDTLAPVDTLTLELQPGTPASIEMVAVPDTITADSVSRSEIRATVYDEFGNWLTSGTPVNFSTNLGVVNPSVSMTDSTGTAVSYLTSSNVPGVATVEATSGDARNMVQVYFVGSMPANIAVWADRNRVTIGDEQGIGIYAMVTDSGGRPVTDGTQVNFSTAIGSIPISTVNTSDGLAGIQYFPETTAGVDTITATAGSVSNFVTIIIEADVCQYIDLTATPDTIAADGRARSVIEATLTDNYGNRLPAGREVTFRTDLGAISPVAYTDSSGQARVNLISAREVGMANVEAECGLGIGRITVEFVSSAAAYISLNADSVSLIANGSSSTSVRATLLDSYGNPVPDGTIVTFHSWLVDSPSVSFGDIDTMATTTSGVATVTLTSERQVGTAMIIASRLGLEDTVYVDFVPGPTARIELSAFPDSIPADNSSTSEITARLYDINSNPVGAGKLVIFSTTGGNLQFTQLYTDSTGAAQVNLVASDTIGQVRVTAQSSGYSANILVWFTPVVASEIILRASPGRIPADGVSISTIEANVLDSMGAAVPDYTPIRFSTSAGTIFPGIAYTESGIATTTLRSSTIPTTATVTADAGGGLVETTPVEFVPGEPASIELTAVPSSIPADGDTSAMIIAVVSDEYGNPVGGGIPVMFTTSLGTIDSVAYTNDIGEAQVYIYAGTAPGRAQIYAYSGEAFQQIQVTFTSTEVASMVLSVEPGELTANGVDEADISGQALNDLGMPVADGSPINFFVQPDSLGRISPGIAYTDSGNFSSTFYTNRIAGEAYIIADAGTVRDSVLIRLTAGEPESIAVEADPVTIPADSSTQSTITATLYDRYGNPVGAGEMVNFATNLGSLEPTTEITGSDGKVITYLTSGREPGIARVRVSSGIARGEVEITFLSSNVGSIILTANPYEITADGIATSTLTASVLDTLGNTVSDLSLIHI